jgi:magnesium transporter
MIKSYCWNDTERRILHDIDLTGKDLYLANPENLLWIDLYDCTDLELNYIGKIFDFHPLAIEECLQTSPRAKVDNTTNTISSFSCLHYDEKQR